MIVILDAAGLSLFAIVGTRKALVYRIESAGGGAVGDDQRSWRRDDSRCFAGAGADGVARGCVCDGGAGGRDRDGGDVSGGSAACVGGSGWRGDLFLFTRGECLGTLEFAAGDGEIDEHVGHEFETA